jgi:hypothetical protein
VPRSIDKIELIGAAILRLVVQRYRTRLDGNAAFFFDVHGIKNLVGHLPIREAAAELDEPVCKRGFAMIYVGDDREIAYMAEITH